MTNLGLVAEPPHKLNDHGFRQQVDIALSRPAHHKMLSDERRDNGLADDGEPYVDVGSLIRQLVQQPHNKRYTRRFDGE